MRVRVGVRVSMAGMVRVVFHVHLSSANSVELITLGAMDAIDAIGCVEWPLRDYLLRVKAAQRRRYAPLLFVAAKAATHKDPDHPEL